MKEQIVKVEIRSNCTVKPCNCKNESQDELYGKGMRLMNKATAKGSKPKRYRCTVCCKEYEF